MTTLEEELKYFEKRVAEIKKEIGNRQRFKLIAEIEYFPGTWNMASVPFEFVLRRGTGSVPLFHLHGNQSQHLDVCAALRYGISSADSAIDRIY